MRDGSLSSRLIGVVHRTPQMIMPPEECRELGEVGDQEAVFLDQRLSFSIIAPAPGRQEHATLTRGRRESTPPSADR